MTHRQLSPVNVCTLSSSSSSSSPLLPELKSTVRRSKRRRTGSLSTPIADQALLVIASTATVVTHGNKGRSNDASVSSEEDDDARMDYPREDTELMHSLTVRYAPEGEDDSPFGRVSPDLLFWMFRTWDPAMRASTVLVCKRWHRVGSAAFDMFRTNQAFLYGVFLDSKHLARLLRDPRSQSYMEDISILCIMFSRISDQVVLQHLAERAIADSATWMTCFEASVMASNASAVDCLLLHPQSDSAVGSIQRVAQTVLRKQDAAILHAVCKRYAAQLGPLFGAPAVTSWCCVNEYAVSLAELLRLPQYRSVQNLALVLRYALVNHLEPLVFAVWEKGILSARQSGRSTLLKACAHNWVRIVFLLMQQGMQPDDQGWTMAMCTAATYGHMDVLKLLCSDPRSNPGAHFNRAVRHALRRQQWEAAHFLLSDPRVAPDDDGDDVARNLLCDAIASDAEAPTEIAAGAVLPLDKTAIVKLLLERGADPNRYNHEPLRRILERGSMFILDALIKCPRTFMTRGEFYAVLAAMPRTEVHRGALDELMRSSRYRGNFM
jgi:hypothetical protein